jgi:hypothetical protein
LATGANSRRQGLTEIHSSIVASGETASCAGLTLLLSANFHLDLARKHAPLLALKNLPKNLPKAHSIWTQCFADSKSKPARNSDAN